MFSSGSRFNPFDQQYLNQTTNGNLSYAQNPSSTQGSHSSPLLYLPTSFDFDDGNLQLARDFLSREQEEEIFVSSTTLEAEVLGTNCVKEARDDGEKKRSNNSDASQKSSVRRRRTGKKDRHSKIFTSRGLRDRRMRLSLPIARKFFDLQDMLGFDKASKTIDWLFTKSKAAIKEFAESLPGVKSSSSATGGKSTAASTSESEVVSGVKLTPDNGNNSYAVAEGDSFVRVSREKKSKRLHKQTFNAIGRESRDQARARARERTRLKMKIKGLDKPPELSSPANPNKLEQLGSFSSLKNGENWGFGSQQIIPPLKMIQEEEYSTYSLQNQMHTISLVDKFLGSTTALRPSIFDFSCTLPVRSEAALEEELTDLSVNWEITNPTEQHRHSSTTRNMKPLTGNVHAQNPNAISMTTQYYPQQQNSSSTLATTSKSQEGITMVQVENASSVFMNISNTNEQSPISVLMTTADTHSRFIENQFSYSCTVPQKHGTLY